MGPEVREMVKFTKDHPWFYTLGHQDFVSLELSGMVRYEIVKRLQKGLMGN